MTEREFALDVVRKLHDAGFTALWAGGCVRDELLGLVPADYDVATNAEPQHLPPLFKRRNEIGAHFGVVQVIGPRLEDGEWLTVEVATFRIDGTYDGRKPDGVKFCTPEEDAKRRDFTINGMFFDPLKNELIDYVGGRADLEAKILRAIGKPAERFTEDKLRILRAVRMASRFDLAIDPVTLDAAKQMAAEIGIVSAERIAEEFRKMLAHPNRGRAIRLLHESGLLGPILPELVPALSQSHRSSHSSEGTAWDHIVRMVDALGSDVSFSLAFAAILHNLGKQTVEAIADRLRLSTAEKTRIAWLVENRDLLADAPSMPASKLYPILIHPGIEDLLAFSRARVVAEGESLAAVEFCERVLRETPRDLLNPVPFVTGDDLIALGMKPGKEFKRLIDAAYQSQLDGQIKEKQPALEFVQLLARELKHGPEKPPESGPISSMP